MKTFLADPDLFQFLTGKIHQILRHEQKTTSPTSENVLLKVSVKFVCHTREK